jgi:hypothetical protein
MTDKLGQGKIADGHRDPRSLKGVARRRELRKEHAEAIRINSTSMLEGLRQRLKREPTLEEKFTAEGICSLFYQAAKERAQGRSDLELLREAATMTNNSVFRSPYAVAPAAGKPE